jgi:hypothetical protein
MFGIIILCGLEEIIPSTSLKVCVYEEYREMEYHLYHPDK